MAPFYPSAREDAACTCGNCAWTGAAADLKPIQSAGERLEAGEETPAGECPECGALAYLDSVALENDKRASALAAGRAMLAALERLTLYHDKDEAFLESCVDYPAVTERTYAQMEAEFWDAARTAIAAAQAAGITTDGAQAEPPRLYITTYTNRHGSGTRAFTTEAARDTYSYALARKLWTNYETDEAPDDKGEFWDAFYQRFPDDNIEDDTITPETKTPEELASEDAR